MSIVDLRNEQKKIKGIQIKSDVQNSIGKAVWEPLKMHYTHALCVLYIMYMRYII